MLRNLLIFSVLAISSFAVADEDVSGKPVHLTGGVSARMGDHRLELRRGADRASLPLSPFVTGIVGATAADPATITLEQTCPPSSIITLTSAELSARFLLAEAERLERKGQRAAAVERLQKALSLAPEQADIRLALARLLFRNKAEPAALEVLQAGVALSPLETYWGVLRDPKLVVLASKIDVAKATPGAGTRRSQGVAPGLSSWAPERGWFTSRQSGLGEDASVLAIVDANERTLLAVPLQNAEGSPAERARTKRQSAMLSRLFAAFAFRPYDEGLAATTETSDELSWLRWKDRGLAASAGGQTIRLRRDGKVVFERKVETAGTIRLDHGQYVPEGPYVLLDWSRRSGSDDCPNGSGTAIVKLSPQ